MTSHIELEIFLSAFISIVGGLLYWTFIHEPKQNKKPNDEAVN